MFDHNGAMWFGGGLMWIFWILFIVILVFIVKAIAGNGASTTGSGEDSPLEILKKRYARGEIDEEEFEHRRRELEH